MEEAESLCDRLAIMDHGRILEMGTTGELIDRHFQERAVRFDNLPGLDNMRPWRSGGRDGGQAGRRDHLALHPRRPGHDRRPPRRSPSRRGVEPDNLTIRQATLEDVFLDLTGRALRD